MGIDVYLQWDDQTKAEQEAQYTGFSVVHGHVGYLREAYHGGPYATKILVREAFEADSAEARIPASVLRERLPRVLETVQIRSRKVYKVEATPEELKTFEDFVSLAEHQEARTGKPCLVIASY